MRAGKWWVGLGVAAAAMSAPSPAGASVDALVAAGPNGSAQFAWTEGTAPGLIQERALSAFGDLTDTQFVSSANRSARSQSIGVDAGGNAVIAWLSYDGSNWVVQARRRAADGALSATQQLSTGGASATAAKLAVEPDGDAIVTWNRPLNGKIVVQARRRAASGELGPVHTLSYAGAHSQVPDVAVAADGAATVVWLRHGPEGKSYVQTRTIAPDGSLSDVEIVSPTTSAATPPLVTLDGGDAIVAWTAATGGAARYRVRFAAGTLGAPVGLSSSAVPDSLTLAGNAAGRAAFSWVELDGGHSTVKGRVRAAGGGLGPVFAPAAQPGAKLPTVALDPAGNATFAWLYEENTDRVFLQRRTAAGAFGTLRVLSSTAEGAGQPHLVVDAGGKATVAWYQVRTSELLTRSVTPGGETSPIQQVNGGVAMPSR